MEFLSRIEETQDRIRPADDAEARQAHEAIVALARPRRTGSPGAAETEAELQRRIQALGYEIHALPFSFSAWPARFGVPLAGATVLAGTAAAVPMLLRGNSGDALAVVLLTASALICVARVGHAAVAKLPWGRVTTANWLVQRRGARPRYLVVAHRDSKSQPISTFLRTAAIVMTLFAWTVLGVLAGLAQFNDAWHWMPLTLAAGALAVTGGVLLVFCRIENESPGALDNATGLAALLGVARREREQDDVAFLITDAEELGLAGARAAAPRLPPVHGVFNLDGLDDDGDIHIVERFGWPRRGRAPHLATALQAAAATLHLQLARRDVPPGVLVDHIAFTDAGQPALTLMRGTLRSLRRVHRPDDDAGQLTGRGAAVIAALVSGALHVLRRAALPG